MSPSTNSMVEPSPSERRTVSLNVLRGLRLNVLECRDYVFQPEVLCEGNSRFTRVGCNECVGAFRKEPMYRFFARTLDCMHQRGVAIGVAGVQVRSRLHKSISALDVVPGNGVHKRRPTPKRLKVGRRLLIGIGGCIQEQFHDVYVPQLRGLH